MALHRDIYWVGRQWAVTGIGLQAVDQRLKGAFDIEIARLWEDELPQRMRALAWLNIDDFNKALELKPDLGLALLGRGLTHDSKGEYDPAIRDLTAAIRLDPKFVSAIRGLGLAYFHAGRYTDAVASNIFNIVANLPKADAQLRNVDTVLTSRSAANCGGSAGSAEPGSAVSAVNA